MEKKRFAVHSSNIRPKQATGQVCRFTFLLATAHSFAYLFLNQLTYNLLLNFNFTFYFIDINKSKFGERKIPRWFMESKIRKIVEGAIKLFEIKIVVDWKRQKNIIDNFFLNLFRKWKQSLENPNLRKMSVVRERFLEDFDKKIKNIFFSFLLNQKIWHILL